MLDNNALSLYFDGTKVEAVSPTGGEMNITAIPGEFVNPFLVLELDPLCKIHRVADFSDGDETTAEAFVGSSLTELVRENFRDRILAAVEKMHQGYLSSWEVRGQILDCEVIHVRLLKLTAVTKPRTPGAASSILGVFSRVADNRPSKPAGTSGKLGKVLGPIEVSILEQLARGHPTSRVAMQIHLSEPGVHYHVSALNKKLSSRNRVNLISKAYHLGIFLPHIWPPRVASPWQSRY